MTAIRRFEDLETWKTARQLANLIFDLTERAPLRQRYSIRDQLERAAVSVMNNVAEGFERRSRRDFARFLQTAKASAAEVSSLAYLSADRNLVSQAESATVLALSDKVRRMIARLRKRLEENS